MERKQGRIETPRQGGLINGLAAISSVQRATDISASYARLSSNRPMHKWLASKCGKLIAEHFHVSTYLLRLAHPTKA